MDYVQFYEANYPEILRRMFIVNGKFNHLDSMLFF